MIDKQGPQTPRDDKKKAASDVLKRVDLLIKQGDLSQALAEAGRAKEIDPRNVYAAAYEERIMNLIKEKEVTAPPPPQVPRPAPPVKKTPAQPVPKEQVPPSPPSAIPPAPSSASPHVGREESLLDGLKHRMESYAKYRQALVEIWSDGTATAKEKESLQTLRQTLGVSPGDHERLEHEVQIDVYSTTLKGAWKQGKISSESEVLLAEMRKTFSISQQDHDLIQARFLAEKQASEKKSAKILVIDDEEKLLELICDTLKEAGLATLPFRTSDEAYAYLKAGSAPDLILCDVNLETSTMGGFSFYEKVQWMEHLVEVPFIFLTGLTDEVLVRTGKELGVDDYLTKPISNQNLIATVKGKLKRFERIRNRRP